MKTMTRIFTVAAMLAVVAVIAAPIASANCLPNKTMTSWGIGGYKYVNLPAGSNNSNVVGRFWQAGGRGLANEGTFDDTQWLRFYSGTSKWYILGELGTAGVFGCPAGSLILTLDTASGQNLTVQLDETPAGNAFDLSRFNTDFNLGTKPRPQVASSARAGTAVNLQVNVQAQTAGIYTLGAAEAATPSYRIVSAGGSSDPGGLASAYAAGPAVAPGTPTPFSANCSNPAVDQWISVQELVDGVPSDTLGARTRISCNPALANPDFKHIDRPGRPNPRSGR
jgi:hypothetical protein